MLKPGLIDCGYLYDANRETIPHLHLCFALKAKIPPAKAEGIYLLISSGQSSNFLNSDLQEIFHFK